MNDLPLRMWTFLLTACHIGEVISTSYAQLEDERFDGLGLGFTLSYFFSLDKKLLTQGHYGHMVEDTTP